MLAEKREENAISQRQFREKLMEELILESKGETACPQPSTSFSAQPGAFKCPGSVPRYFGGTAEEKRRICVWCKQNGSKRKTPLYCPKCNVALCLQPDRNCFEDYHKNL